MNRSIMYWKWDNDVLDPEVMDRKLNDLTSRTQIGSIFIGTQWIVDHFHGEKIGAAFRRCIDGLHAAGRKAMIECCIRNEGEPFYKQYPDEPSYLLSFYEGQADEKGRGTIVIPAEPVWHYWRKSGDHGEFKLFCAYRMKKSGAFSYKSCERFDKNVTARSVKQGGESQNVVCFGGTAEQEIGYNVVVEFEGAEAGDTVAVCVGFPQPIVDLAHPMLIPYFRKMAEHAKELGADGVFSDEWGYDMILKIVKPNPYDDTELNLRHVSYSRFFEQKHLEFTGKPLLERLVSLFYTDEGHPEARKEAVDGYLRALRLICTQNEEEMYAVVKEVLGKDAFWGVHPTWWGSVDSLNFEFFKNGFYWWDAKRDYAQTDEMIAYPIRTALAHRWDSPVWYNMWYSMGTRDINTYYDETWKNLRYGGRTHYLGYECPNEAVVLELKPEGMMESIEEMDKRVRLFDGVAVRQPDCRLCLLFGYESVSNWADIGMEMPWKPQNPRLDMVLNTAQQVFSRMLCDLVPSYAAENGSLFVNGDGKAQYGDQEYDAVVVLYPGRMSEGAKAFLRAADKTHLAVCYEERDADTLAFVKELAAAGATVSDAIPSAEALAQLAAERFGVPANRYELGVKFQDGSYLFTTDGKKNVHNPLVAEFECGGKRVRFEGYDALWISPDLKKAVYPEGILTVDGKKIRSSEELK